jgi:uncharacterized protein (TIRG00374 family)
LAETKFSTESVGLPEDNGRRRFPRRLIGYTVAAACLAWVFYDLRPDRMLKSLVAMDWRWILPAIGCDLLSYLSQGGQWRFLLQPLGKISLLKATQAIYAGLFANEVLPMRAGEFLRAFLVSRWLSADFLSVVPSVIVGRLFDSMWLAVGIGLTAIFLPLPKDLADAAEILGFAVLAAFIVLSFLLLRRKTSDVEKRGRERNKWRPIQFVSSLMDTTAQGIKAIGFTRRFGFSFLVSALCLFFEVLAFWMVMQAYRIELSLWAGAAALLIVRLGTLIPNTPSNIGTYQFFVVLALSLLGVHKEDAAGFSAVVFVVLTVPLWIIGLFAMGRSGIKLRHIPQEMKKAMRQGAHKAP